MSRIALRFEQLRAAGRTALIPYLTAGDPAPSATVPAMHALVAAGADLIEVGVPFSDPMADGPVIQAACERALAAGTRLTDVLAMVQRFREVDGATPVVLMGYLNPIERMGLERFSSAAAQAGVDGVLIVDLPPEEADEVGPLFQDVGLDPIFLISPTTTDQRVQSIATQASGFLYYVSLKGVTGSAALDVNALKDRLQRLRRFTTLPLGVGFGIRDAETAARVGAVSDAVIVGSAIVQRAAEHTEKPENFAPAAAELIATMRAAIDAGSSGRIV